MSTLVPVDSEVLPARPDAERSLLGAILIDGSLLSRVMEFLVPEDFASEAHRLVYEACLALADRREGVDLVTVQSELEKTGRLERAGGAAVLSSLVDRVPDVENVESYARLVRESSLRRLVIFQSRRAIRDAVTAPDAETVLENAQRDLVEIAKGSIRGGFVKLSRIAEKNEEEIQKIHGRGTMLTGLPTGFTRLNALTQGFQKTDLVVVAARPGMGKTAFALNIASYLTIHQKFVVGFFSLEMSAQQLGFRIQCAESRVNLQRLREGRLSKEEKKALFFSTQQMREAQLFVDDSPAATLLEMRARALQLKQRHGLDALFVDYLQIMGSRGKVENRTQEVSAFSRGLKALAKELEVPVIALSQLSRRTEQRGSEKEPVLSDLRESGAIEQDADVVLFLSRPEYYDKDTEQKNVCDVIIAKQRNGPTDRFTLGWSGEYTRFSDLAMISEGPGL
ncbi:MAG TPA: replicative DNA helicase [Thermoanaerobaculia bacterium]|nr:replicative DNA helicase [Thermoanaerobaculia bacterium]